MAYSHSRLRKTLALVRIGTGVAFVSLGWYKVASLEFAKFAFPDFLDTALRGGAAGIVQPLLQWILNAGPARVGVAIGFLELFIGIALVLGLAVRPACALGMVYMATVWLCSWNPPAAGAQFLQTTEFQFRNLFPLLVFLQLAVGHAGETWGIGALYHHHRDRRWAEAPVEAAVLIPPRHEPASFEEYAEAEAEERQLAMHGMEETDANESEEPATVSGEREF